MLVFIDDSGDPGFKLGKGSSTHFVISMVIFDDDLEAEKAAVRIKELKRELKLADSVEFKFAKSSSRIKIAFLKGINPFNFDVRFLAVDKEKIYSQDLMNNKNRFYSFFIKELLKHSGKAIPNARIKIDGHGDRAFRRNFITYLRRELNSKDRIILESCKIVDSKENVLIQMADMISGSINRSYNAEKADRGDYKKIIEKHIKNAWNFK